LISYILYAKRKAYPVINVRLFCNRQFRYFISVSAATRLLSSGIWFLLPLYLQTLHRVLPASLRCYKIIKIFLYFLPKKLDRVFDHFFEILEIFALFKINPLRAIMLDENQFYI
jgi:hypothetical protein